MKKSTIPQSIKVLKKWYNSNTLDLKHPVQRASEQWNLLQKSLLVHSILSDYIVPPLYLTKDKIGKTTIYHLLEGKQRVSNMFSFIDDEFSLHAKTPDVYLDGKRYVIALKKFSELEDELREEILGFFFTIYQIEEATEEEIEESFTRLNSGTPLSKIQQARPKMGTELADWCNKLIAKDFFQKSLNLTIAQLRREDDFLMLITTMMLIDSRYDDGFKIKTAASASECLRFSEHIKNNYPQKKREEIELLVEYLCGAFKGAEYKFLKKNNVPIIMFVGNIALNKGIPEDIFLNTVVEFFDTDCTVAYEEASGSGNVKLVNVNTRINELMGYFMSTLPEYFEDEDEIPTSFRKKIESTDEDSPVQENDTPTTGNESNPQEEEIKDEDENTSDGEEEENSEDSSEELSSDAESEEDSENDEEEIGEESENTEDSSDNDTDDEAVSEEPSDTGEQLTA